MLTEHLTTLQSFWHLSANALAATQDHGVPTHGAAGAVVADRAGHWSLLLIALLPFAGFVLSGLFAAARVKSKVTAWMTVGLLAASFGIVLNLFFKSFTHGDYTPVHVHGFEWIALGGAKSFVANFAFRIDSLTCLWMLFVTGLATLIALYSSEYMSHDLGAGYNRYFAAFNLFVFSMSCLVMADNLVLTFLGWEGVGLCSYLLIGYFYKRPSAVAAAKKAFIMNRIGDLGLLMAMFGIYVAFGTVEYRRLFELIAMGVDGGGNPLGASWAVKALPVLITLGAFGKSAQLFLYVWLPDAMEGPTPVSALIHAATMVTAGVFLVARMFPLYLADPDRLAITIVAWSGALTALWAATIGMAYYDIKRVMGYSTVSQLGYMFAGLGLLTTSGGVFHVFTHAFFKATLFLCCGAVMHGFAGQLDLRKLSGVWKMKGWGVVGFAMLIGCINLAGVPFTAGFFSKDMILAQAFSTPCTLHDAHADGVMGAPILGWILLITAGMTAYYTFRVFFRVFLGPAQFEPGDEVHAHEDHAHGDHGHDAHGHDAHGHDAHGHDAHAASPAPAAAHFHPHAPGWAMNLVMGVCALLSIAAAGVYFVHPAAAEHGATAQAGVEHVAEHGGWVAAMVGASSAAVHSPHGGTFLGMDPHKVMYYVSAGVGTLGILLAAYFHLLGRTQAATARADALFANPLIRTVHTLANRKWFVDEFYDAIIVRPLRGLSHVFHLVDQYLVDGIVNFFGAVPKMFGRVVRPLQNGELHAYAIGMAGGLAVILILVLALAS